MSSLPIIARLLLLSVFLFCNSIASANGSAAREGIGGLEFIKNHDVELRKEFLDISRQKIQLTYEFFNTKSSVVETKIAFPFGAHTVARQCHEGGRDASRYAFKLNVNGLVVNAEIKERFVWQNKDVTWLVKLLANVPTDSYLQSIRCDHDSFEGHIYSGWWEFLLRWVGVYGEHGPLWSQQQFAWWPQAFEPSVSTKIAIEYEPIAGWRDWGSEIEQFSSTMSRPQADADMNSKDDIACLDESGWRNMVSSHRAALETSYKESREKDENGGNGHIPKPLLTLYDVEYVSGTGNNWKGPIQDFRLRITKNRPEDKISLCFPGNPQRISNRSFEFQHKNFVLPRSIVVYFFESTKR